jgi:hypothetical protein
MKHFTTLLFLFSTYISFSQTWQWAATCDTYLSSGYSDGTSVCTDPAGNIFITGLYVGTLTAGSYTLNGSTGEYLPYLAKYNSAGNVLWAKTAISSGVNNSCATLGSAVCSDQQGNSYLSGYFCDASIAFGSYTLTNTGIGNMFLVKYDPAGNVLWARNPVHSGTDWAYSVSCDANNNVFVTGVFNGTTIAFGSSTLTNTSSQTMFLVKYDPNGNVIWARNPTGDVVGDDYFGTYVSAESNGNTFVAGSFTNSTLVFGTYTLSGGSGQNTFLVKYDASGNVVWATGSNNPNCSNRPFSVSADGIGNAYITGQYSSAPLVFGSYTLTNSGVKNMFLTKYNASGNVLWAKRSISAKMEAGLSVSSNSNAVFVSGMMDTTTVFGTYTISPPTGSVDPAFFTQYDANGNVVFAEALVSGGDDWIAVSLDKFCHVYLTGDFSTNTFVIGSNTLILTGSGNPESTFLAKFTYCQQIPDHVSENSLSNSGARLFPNPNSGQFTLVIDEEAIEARIRIMNSLGQEIFSQEAVRGLNEIKMNGLGKGLYYYSLEQNKNSLQNGKISIE